MPAPKYKARAKAKAEAEADVSTAHFSVGPWDAFPQPFIDVFSAIPQERDEPPKKRMRIDAPEYVVIGQETLVVSRPCPRPSTQSKPDMSFERRNIGSYVAVDYFHRRGRGYVLEISSQAVHSVVAELDLGPTGLTSLRPALVEMLKGASHGDGSTRYKNERLSDNGIWTTIDASFERSGDRDCLKLTFSLNWNLWTPASKGLRTSRQRVLSNKILATLFSRQASHLFNDFAGLSPQDFYAATFTPSEDHPGVVSAMIPSLKATLFPFQGRALQWLLHREGVHWTPDRGIEPLATTRSADLPLCFNEAKDVSGNSYYISHLLHVVTRDIGPFIDMERIPSGGILAEEMGLGKTVETIALILMHRRPPHAHLIPDPYTGQEVRPIGTTLIITPQSLMDQWLSEFRKHAPDLRVMVYHGTKRYNVLGNLEQIETKLPEHDVVVTTYNVLQTDIHYAELPPQRALRHGNSRPRSISPLKKFSWWRVCLDEAQLIESGVSNAAKIVRTIPRVNSWGITGTPVKENIKDLWGLLLFLRYEPYASYPSIWDAITTTNKDVFMDLFKSIALRHSKKVVRGELFLPRQKRYVITMPFTAVEEQYYQSQFNEMAHECGLDGRGVPIRDEWNADDPVTLDLMKRALAQLRQTVLHPEMGAGRARVLAHRSKPLRTIKEVLEAMIEQSESSIRADQRLYILSKLERGSLLENSPRVKEALAIWEETLKEIRVIVEQCRRELEKEIKDAEEAGDQQEEGSNDESEDKESEDHGSFRVGEARRNLRFALDLEHRAVFFIASAYYQIKSNEDMTQPDSEEYHRLEKLEVAGYELAKQIRKEILQEAHKKASSIVDKVNRLEKSKSLADIPLSNRAAASKYRELANNAVINSLDTLYSALDKQAALIRKWRTGIIRLISRPLVDKEGEVEVTGDEYEDSTETQEELMAFTQFLRALIADRQAALTGVANQLVNHETQSAERLAKNGRGPAPGLTLELLALRDSCNKDLMQGSFRAVVTELREWATKFRHESSAGNRRAVSDLAMVQDFLRLTQDEISDQMKAAVAFDKELDMYTAAMNARMDYYRQLQTVSDSVAPGDPKPNINPILTRNIGNEAALQRRVTTERSKHRYLLNLRDDDKNSPEDKICAICQYPFILGVLTICGHQFCKGCLEIWHKTYHNCPMCKRHLTPAMVHSITLKKRELKVQAEGRYGRHESISSHKLRKSGIYSDFSADKLRAIKDIRLDGPSVSTKVDMLIKHILWLREADPGAKSIIFSQFKEFLDLLGRTFHQYRIGFTTFDKPAGISRFKEDPGVECFLMDARAHASGLNLVNASHVFLVEPMLNTALELQAIARVHRIGQKHDTTVWLYLIEGTVEESIYNLSVQRRMEHMSQNGKGKSKELTDGISDMNLEAANSMELQQAELSKLMNRDRQLGEVVDKGDLWQCLFGHLSAEAPSPNEERIDEPEANINGFLSMAAAEMSMGPDESEAGPSNA